MNKMVILTIDSTKDSRILEDDPDVNFGTSTYVATDIDSNSGHIIRSLVEFDLSSLLDVPIDNISSASLYLFCISTVGTPRAIDIQLIDSAWTETGVTWNNQPTSLDYNTEHTWSSSSTWSYVSIRSILKDALRNDDSSIGLLLKYLDEVADGTKDSNTFSSKEGSFDPYIKIEYAEYSQTLLHGSLCNNLLFKDGFGEITMTDHNCPTGDAAEFTFKTQWGSSHTTVLLDVGDTEEYVSGTKHHSFKLYSMSCNSAPCDNLAAAAIEERFWDTGNAYVKVGGDNDRHGRSWAEAWETITHAANEVFDGQEVHIGFGTYDSETDVTPDNAGSTGIKYTPETAGTGGGTGSVTINM